MREYGQIQCAYWQHASEQGWSTDAMLLGAYLLTGPHSNGIGTFRVPTGYIQDDLDWDRERVSETLAELSDKGFCKVFGRVVHIPKFLRWNPIANGNVAKARAAEFEALPSEDAKAAAAPSLLAFGNHWPDDFRNRLETLSKRYGEQDPTQPNPTQPNPTQRERAPSGARQPKGDSGKAAGGAKQTRGSRIPDGFPDAGALEWARSECPGVDAEREAAKFRDHWLAASGARGVKLDWLATWRNWVRRADEFSQSRPAPSGGDARASTIEQARRLRGGRGGGV